MKINRKKGYFSISAVAKMFSIHQQTVRLYEREGLISPKRSAGNTRLFSEEDIDRLEEVIYLTHELGINLAGVEMIFKLKKQIKKMQEDMNKVFENTQKQLDHQVELSQSTIKGNAQKIMQMKKNTINITKPPLIGNNQTEASGTVENESGDDLWEIEYEE